LYWSFAGNKYANWRQFIPTNFKFIKDLWTIFKVDILMIGNKEHVAVGHNAMAGFIYFFAFLASLVQIFTGFGLYASTGSWWFPKLFAWVPAILGGDILTRQVHHWTMWFFILFMVIHVYLVFYHDYIEGRGEMSSMAGGYKFMEEEKFETVTPAPLETPVAEIKTNPDKITTDNVAAK
jgi:Ni/Fe-hydrogenase 1 B-type cytochrome subunit